MTKQQLEEEISRHLNGATQSERQAVLNDIEYKMAWTAGDLQAAFQRTCALLYGTADNPAKARTLRKRKQKVDAILKQIDEI